MTVDVAGDPRKGPARKRSRPRAKMMGKARRTRRRRTTADSLCDTLRTEIAVLETEIATTERKLCTARDEADKERNRLLLELLATEQMLLKNKTKRLALAFQKAEPILDQAILKLDRAVRAALQLNGRSAG
jgi:hypothetical protein